MNVQFHAGPDMRWLLQLAKKNNISPGKLAKMLLKDYNDIVLGTRGDLNAPVLSAIFEAKYG